ncbi:MAG: hypothetical protein NT094_01580, partial [Candidatus Staskawiczbacteria bacterium]|nr:hypothetical protein [Candidatus Staskawiczbacteria bacterium]
RRCEMKLLMSSVILSGGGVGLALCGYVMHCRKTSSRIFSTDSVKSWWSNLWGANALQGQFFMLYIGMSMMMTDLVMGNKVNFDQFKTFSSILSFLPLILPAAGIDIHSEGTAKWILTFGTSLVFGGYPAFAIAGLCHIGDTGDPTTRISSISVTVTAFMVIGMYWSFFHVGHLSRFYLFFEYNVFKDPSTPPAIHTLMLGLIYESNPSMVRQMLRSIHQRDMDGLFGPKWCTGEIEENSLWAQMVNTVMLHTKDWRDARRGQKLLFIQKAHLDMMDWAINIVKLVEDDRYTKGMAKNYITAMQDVLARARDYIDPPSPGN